MKTELSERMKNKVIECFDDVSGLDDEEISNLYYLILDRDSLDGFSSVLFENSSKGWCTSRKYDLMERTIYTIHYDRERMWIEERYVYEYDSGERYISTREYVSARDVLRVIGRVLGRREFITVTNG